MEVIITFGNKSLLESKKAFFENEKSAIEWEKLLTSFDPTYKINRININGKSYDKYQEGA